MILSGLSDGQFIAIVAVLLGTGALCALVLVLSREAPSRAKSPWEL